MNKQAMTICALCALCSSAAFAVFDMPEVLSLSWSKTSKAVTIGYALSEPAIVTADIQTNAGDNAWVSIGAKNFAGLTGDVNKLVSKSAGTIVWPARTDWPDQKVEAGKLRVSLKAWSTNAPPDYMVIELLAYSNVTYYASLDALPDGGLTNDLYRTSRLVMRRIPAACKTWRMDRASYGGVQDIARVTTLTKDFYLGIYELTLAQWQCIQWRIRHEGSQKPCYDQIFTNMRGSTRKWPGDGHDVDDGCWVAMARVKTGVSLDFPTEAQWDFACHGGNDAPLYSGKGISAANEAEIAQCASSRESNPSLVGRKIPNNYGLYDMIGNVAETCLDYYTTTWSAADWQDPKGPATGTTRTIRGGNSNYTYLMECSTRGSVSETASGGWSVGYRLSAPCGAEW